MLDALGAGSLSNWGVGLVSRTGGDGDRRKGSVQGEPKKCQGESKKCQAGSSPRHMTDQIQTATVRMLLIEEDERPLVYSCPSLENSSSSLVKRLTTVDRTRPHSLGQVPRVDAKPCRMGLAVLITEMGGW